MPRQRTFTDHRRTATRLHTTSNRVALKKGTFRMFPCQEALENRLVLSQLNIFTDSYLDFADLQTAINNLASDVNVVYFHSTKQDLTPDVYVFPDRLRLKGRGSTNPIEYRGDPATYDSLNGSVVDPGTVIMKDAGTVQNPQHDHYAFDIPANTTRSYITIDNLTFDGCGIALLNGATDHLSVTNNLCRNGVADPDANPGNGYPYWIGAVYETTGLTHSDISHNIFQNEQIAACITLTGTSSADFSDNTINNNTFSDCNAGVHIQLDGNAGANHNDFVNGNVGTGLRDKLIEIVGTAAENLTVSGNKVSDFAFHDDSTMGLSIPIHGANVTNLRITNNEISDIPGVGIANVDDHLAGVRIGIEVGGIQVDNISLRSEVYGNRIYGAVYPISIAAGYHDYVHDNEIVYFTGPGPVVVQTTGVPHDPDISSQTGTAVLPTNKSNTTIAFDTWVTGDVNPNTFSVGSDGTITKTGTGIVGTVPDNSSIPGLGPGRAVIYGFGGNDTLMADTTANPTVLARYALAGGYGAGDTTSGSDGTDTLIGGAGTDTLFSGNSADVLELDMTQAAHFPGKPIVVGHPVNVDGSTSSSVQSTFKLVGTTGADTVTFASATVTFGSTNAISITKYNINAVQFDGLGGYDTVPVTGGPSVDFPTTQHFDSLNLGNGTSASMIADGTHVFVTRALVVGTGAKLDLHDNDFVLDYTGSSQLATIQGLINSARNGGTWDGTRGLTSSTARDNADHSTTLGAMEATTYSSVHGGTFDGESLDSTAVAVKYTYYGDTEFDGDTDFDDYIRVDNGFNNHLSGWSNGDADGDGNVNFNDYVLVDLAFNHQAGHLRGGEGGNGWAEVAQLDHFQLDGYEDYLIDALAQLGIHVTDQDFHP